jgi:hypothetical protein
VVVDKVENARSDQPYPGGGACRGNTSMDRGMMAMLTHNNYVMDAACNVQHHSGCNGTFIRSEIFRRPVLGKFCHSTESNSILDTIAHSGLVSCKQGRGRAWRFFHNVPRRRACEAVSNPEAAVCTC